MRRDEAQLGAGVDSRTPVLLQGWRIRSVWQRWAAATAASWQATWSANIPRCCRYCCCCMPLGCCLHLALRCQAPDVGRMLHGSAPGTTCSVAHLAPVECY